MGGLMMLVALPLMLFGGLALDALTNDDSHHPAKADDHDEVVGDVPQGDEPPLI